METFTLGNTIPFQSHQLHGDPTIQRLHLNVSDVEFIIHGSDGRSHQAIAIPVVQYQYTIDDLRRFETIWMVNIGTCTVSDTCSTNGHSMLILDTYCYNGITPASHWFYDLPQYLLSPQRLNPLVFDADGPVEVRLQRAVSAATSSMRWNGGNLDWPYVATVFDGQMTVTRGDVVTLIHAPGSAKRLITAGESIYVPCEPFEIVVRDTFADLATAPAVTAASISDAIASAVDDDTPTDVDALRSELDAVRSELDAKSARLMRYEAMLASARETVIKYTEENSGCDDGKYNFLHETGLWPDYGRDELLELVGIETDRDYMVTLEVSMAINVPINCSQGFVEDMGNDDFVQHVGQDAIDDAIMAYVRDTDADIDIIDVNLA